MQRQASGYAEIDAPDESHNVSFLLTLLTMLDFTQPGQVQKEDWERGVGALYAPGLSWEVSWQMLLRRFDLDFNGSIDFGEMHGLAPLDPRLGSLLRVMMQTLVRLSERINGAYAGINETKMKMMRGTVNQWRDKITATAFKAWRDDVRSIAARRAIVLANMKYAPCRKCFHGIKEMIRERKTKMSKAANLMAGKETRLLQISFSNWSEAVFVNKRAKEARCQPGSTSDRTHGRHGRYPVVVHELSGTHATPCTRADPQPTTNTRAGQAARVLHGQGGVVEEPRRSPVGDLGALRAVDAPLSQAVDVPVRSPPA